MHNILTTYFKTILTIFIGSCHVNRFRITRLQTFKKMFKVWSSELKKDPELSESERSKRIKNLRDLIESILY